MEATQQFTPTEVARILGTTEERIGTLARLGGVAPAIEPGGARRFTFQQVLLLRTTQGLLDSGVPANRVKRVWASLRRQLDEQTPLTSVRVEAEGHRAVASDGRSRWQPESGQFLLDLEGGGAAGHATATLEVEPFVPEGADAAGTPADVPMSAEHWFELGSELETTSPAEARAAYRHALEVDPTLADAHLNLGRLEHEAGELGKAEAHYRDAVRHAPDDAVMHFNLGVLLEDRRRPEEAILAYRRAIECDADAADAHYNLGLLLESRGRKAEAIRHLMTARRLYAEAGREP